MKIFIVAIGFIFLSIYESAYAVTIIGEPSCGKWVQFRDIYKSRQSVQNSELMKMSMPELLDYMGDAKEMDNYGNWLYGYLSGLASASGKDFLNRIDNISIILWIDNYCAKQPLDGLSVAGYELMRAVNNRARER